MTISTSSSSVTVPGTGSATSFAFPFIADSVSVISVTYTDTFGNETVLQTSQYSIVLTPPANNQLWGVGGIVTYPLSGSPIAIGTSLTIARVLPYTQEVSIQNQGNYYAQVTEQALDVLEMQIQQIANSSVRALQIPSSDPPSINTIYPAAAARANQFAAFDSSGNAIAALASPGTVPISAAMQPVVQAATITAATNLLGVTPSVFIATTVGGTASAITVTNTAPSNFQLNNGVLLTITPPNVNTGATTLAVGATGVPYPIYKVGGVNLVPLQAGDVGGFPVIFQFSTNINGLGTSGWIGLSVLLAGRINYLSSNYVTTGADLWQYFVATTGINFTLPSTLAVFNYFWEELNASGGAITLIPNGTDTINGVNANFVIPQGGSAKLLTDGNGHWFTDFLVYPPAVSYAPGAYVNKFRNVVFDVAQRGTSGTVTTGNVNYTLDGWQIGSTGATAYWGQYYGNLDGVNFGSSLQILGATSMTDTVLKQRIESSICAPLASKNVTVQFAIYNALASGSITPTLTIKHATARDNFGTLSTDVNAVSLQTVPNATFAVLAYTFFASQYSENGLEVTLDFGAALNSASNSVYISYADIRATPGLPAGLCNTPPIPEIRPVATELPYCQRYYSKSFSQGVAPSQAAGAAGALLAYIGFGYSGGGFGATAKFPTTMRIVPTVTTYNPTNANANWHSSSGNDYAPTVSNIGDSGFSITGVSGEQSQSNYIHYTASSEL